MAIAVVVVVFGLIVGVALELLLSKGRGAPRANSMPADMETLRPSAPRPSEPRFVEDGEGFRILDPADYRDDVVVTQETDDDTGGSSGT